MTEDEKVAAITRFGFDIAPTPTEAAEVQRERIAEAHRREGL